MDETRNEKVTYPDVYVQLSGEDGNAHAVIARVRRALREAHGTEQADAFVAQALGTGSYDELLWLVVTTVETG